MSRPEPASPWWEAVPGDGSLELRLTEQGAALLDLLAKGFSQAEAEALISVRDGVDGPDEQ